VYARRNPAPCAGRLKRLEEKLLQERDRRLKRQTDELKQSLIPADKAEIMMPEIVATFDCCAKALYAHKLLDELAGMNEPAVVRHNLKKAVQACKENTSELLIKLCE
jgi:hypothetical protein